MGFRSPGNSPRYITYALDAGAAFVKTTAGAVAWSGSGEALPVRRAAHFFGDDIVVDAAAIQSRGPRLPPSENFVLHMLHGGEAIL